MSNNKSLFSIEQEYLDIMAKVEEADGELTDGLENALQINREELSTKCINYHKVMNMYDSHIGILKSEIERLTNLKKTAENSKERLNASLLQAVLLFGEEDKKGIKRLEFPTLKLSTRRSKGGVEIIDEEKLDLKYVDFTIAISKLDQKKADEYEAILKDQELNYKKSKTVSKTKIKEDLDKIIKENEANATLAELEGKEFTPKSVEVNGAKLSEDKFGLNIK